MQNQITNRKIAIFIIAIIFLILLLLSLIKIPCPIHKITGFYCPGCGMTRMLKAMLHLDFYQAFRYNPLCFILSPFLLFLAISNIYSYLFNKENEFEKKIDNRILYFIIILLIIFGILRNIDMFSYLAPTKI